MTIPIFTFSGLKHVNMLKEIEIYNWLVSYHYLKTFAGDTLKDKIERLEWGNRGDYFVLDSGAFSAWRQGITIDVFEYAKAVNEVQDYFTDIVCIDAIDDPVTSEANHLIMLEEGCKNVMPVFHSGEPLSVLKYLINQGYPYIGISPNNDWPEGQKQKWLAELFATFDMNKIKTHGFGYTSLEGLKQYPLTTADSATWIFLGAFGSITTPFGRCLISDRMKDSKDHLNNWMPHDKEKIVSYVKSMGYTIDELTSSPYRRQQFNAQYFVWALQRPSEQQTQHSSSLLFQDDNTGFGYITEEFTAEAVYKRIDEIRSGKVKPMPKSSRESPKRKKEQDEPEISLF